MREKKPTIFFYPLFLWGHLMPMRGMMREFARRGHRVIVYATDEFESVIKETGAHYVSCDKYGGATISASQSLSELYSAQIPFLTAIEAFMMEALTRYAPVIAVIDQDCIWGKLLAPKYNLPHVLSAPTIPFNKKTRELFREDIFKHIDAHEPVLQQELNGLRNSGFPESTVYSLLLLDEDTDCIAYFAKGFLPYPKSYSMEHLFFAGNKGGKDDGEKLPEATLPGLPEKKTRPFVFVTMGTTGSYNPFFWMNCIRAFAGKDVDVVMILWKYLDKEMFTDVPDNVTIIVEGDQREYLKHADLMICHGGLNTITDGLWAKVPMILLPLIADQFQNCRIVEELHAGKVLDDYKAQTISAAVDELLSDESYRSSAAAMGDEMRASGTTEELCDWILERHTPKDMDRPMALSFQQSDMLEKYCRYSSARALMNVGFVMDFASEDGVRGIYALLKALAVFVEKNDGARIRIQQEELPEVFVQRFHSHKYMPDVNIMHFKERDDRYKGFLMKCYTDSFALYENTFRFWIAVFENGEFCLIAVFDHVNTDQYALSLANDAIRRLYQDILNEDVLSYAPPSFADFVDRQSDYLFSARHRRDVDFWQGYLEGLSRLLTPSAGNEGLSDAFTIYRVSLTADQIALLNETASQFSISMDTLAFALYALLCGRYLRQEELFINRRYLNRIHKEDMELFANCRAELPVHVKLSREKSFGKLCAEIQKDSIILQRHGRISVLELEELVAGSVGERGSLPLMPVFGIGTEGFCDITKAFSKGDKEEAKETVMPIAGTEDRDLDLELSFGRDGGAGLTLRGHSGRLSGCSGFAAFSNEMFLLCERLRQEGDVELDTLFIK